MAKPLKVTASILAPHALQQALLSRYSVARKASCQFYTRGISDTYRVCAADLTYFLRVYQAGARSLEEIQAELRALQVLQRAGMPVSVPVATVDGGLLLPVDAPEGRRFGVLFTEAQGKPFRRATPEQARGAGTLAARLHNVADEKLSGLARRRDDCQNLLQEPLRLIRRQFARHTEELTALDSIGDQLACQVELLERDAAVYGFCHRDLQGKNVHLTPDGVMTLFDFDLCGYSWRAFELSVFLFNQWWCRSDDDGYDLISKAFLAGYQERLKRPSPDRPAICLFLALHPIYAMGFHLSLRHRYGEWRFTRNYLRHWLDAARQLFDRFVAAK